MIIVTCKSEKIVTDGCRLLNRKKGNTEENGAGNGTRTHDIQLGKLTLYQLSYTRMALIIKAHAGKHKQRAANCCFKGKKSLDKKNFDFGDQTANAMVIVSKTFFFSR